MLDGSREYRNTFTSGNNGKELVDLIIYAIIRTIA